MRTESLYSIENPKWFIFGAVHHRIIDLHQALTVMFERKIDILFDYMKEYHGAGRPLHLIIERYHNNTHRIKIHLISLDLLFRIQTNDQSLPSMCQDFCYHLYRDHYKDSESFSAHFNGRSSIESYRGDCGINRTINQILRLKSLPEIYKQTYFLVDLYREIEKKYKQQKPDETESMVLKISRGQQMRRNELIKLLNNIGRPVYNNNFLSATFDRSVACTYAATATSSTETVSVLLDIEIDSKHSTRPYGYIPESGEEQEIIIVPGTIFRVETVEQDDGCLLLCDNLTSDEQKSELWRIQLNSIDEKQLLGDTLTILNETNMIEAAQPVVMSFFFFHSHLMRLLSKVETGCCTK